MTRPAKRRPIPIERLKVHVVDLSREIWARIYRSMVPWAVHIDEHGNSEWIGDESDKQHIEGIIGDIKCKSRKN